MTSIFIDGSAGTTGLRIRERLAGRNDISLIVLPEELRKDISARRDALNSADIAFLCLPDAAAIEAVSLIDNPNVVVIDTSTAHRVNPDWVYGLPELPGQREKIIESNRIANPGCHASGFIILVAPLVSAGIIPQNALLTCTSLTGYSGGGKKMIEEYESASRNPLLIAPRQYGLTQEHKHLKEMTRFCNLDNHPAFMPIVADFYSGMETIIPIFPAMLGTTVDDIRQLYHQLYNGPVISVSDAPDADGMLSASAFSGKDSMNIGIFGNNDRAVLIARYDNLGKGASGAAIQNMNIVMGTDEICGLDL